jgi:ribonuclease HI
MDRQWKDDRRWNKKARRRIKRLDHFMLLEPNDVTPGLPEAPGLQDLLMRFNIKDWDVLLVGDGSGSQWERACGWACVLVEQAILTPKLFYGAASAGTNYTAELEAYLRPMLWYSEGPGKERLKWRASGRTTPLGQVHILTDCQTLAKQGNGFVRRDRNRPLWAALEKIAEQGYQFHWHWMPREACALNQWADRQSKLMRTTLTRIDQAMQQDLLGPEDRYNECSST